MVVVCESPLVHQKCFAVQAGICRKQDLVGASLELGSPSCGCSLLKPLA